MAGKDEISKTAELSKTFLAGVRGAVPLAAEQIDTMLRILQATQPQVKTFLDLGCGDAILANAISQADANSGGILLNFSEPMLQAATSRCPSSLASSCFLLQDFGQNTWVESVATEAPLDGIMSGFVVHHPSDDCKRELYAEIYQLLKREETF